MTAAPPASTADVVAGPDGSVSAVGGERPIFRLGTRGSTLAVMQSSTVAEALRALGADVELVTVRTAGDDRPPDTAWGEGAFVGALEAALLDGSVDLAVHSAKDVPTAEHELLVIAAYPKREDPRDALVGREPGLTLAALPAGTRVGTDSPRRSAFLRAARPDLRVHPLHGNVDPRLRRLDSGATDVLVLAVAGLARLGRRDRIDEVLAPDVVHPAPGQGALAIQCRAADERTRAWLERLDDAPTRAAVEAERAFLLATGGGCRAPIGALARVEGDEIVLSAATAGLELPPEPDGARPGPAPTVARGEIRGPVEDRVALASALAARLTARLAESVDATPAPTSRRRVLLTRPESDSTKLVDLLRMRGLDASAIPTIEIAAVDHGGPLDAALASAPLPDWVVVTSANGANATLDAATRLGVDLDGTRWAAVGPATAAALRARGIEPALVGSADGVALASELGIRPGERILLPRSDIADGRLVDVLEERGAQVEAVVAYRTIEGPRSSRDRSRALFASGAPDAIVFTSGSTVRGLVALLAPAHLAAARAAVACCIGPRTADAAAAAGFQNIRVAAATDPRRIADLIEEALGHGREEDQ